MSVSEADVLRARPHSIAIDVTSKCNLRCSYCHKSDEVYEALPASNADMADEIIDRLYGECKEAGIKFVSLSCAGETTMSPEWHKRVMRFLDDAELDTHIVSNFARLFNSEDLTALAKFKVIQISFDSAEPEMVRKLRSKADLRTIAFNIVRLRQRGRELGRTPMLIVNCTLWRDNIGGIAQLAGLCRELAVDQLLLTEGFVSTRHNYRVPDTLDTLSDQDVVVLAQQVVAAENVLAQGSTALRLQSHLSLRLGAVLEQIRQGDRPRHAATVFNRQLALSACRQPWQSPLVTADGRVWPCCRAGEGEPIGQLATATTVTEILDGDAARAVRAAVLDGKTTLPCDKCSYASELALPDFVQEVREWQGGPAASRKTDVRSFIWPGLLGRPEHQVVLENAELTCSRGIASLIENNFYGLHRVLLDSEHSTQIVFGVRPKGRRRLRLDLASGHVMVGRAHVAATRMPSAELVMGELNCRFRSLPDGWLEVAVQSSKPFSHVNITLMSEDNAVTYRGDGRSAIELSELALSSG